jgi:vitamin B12 transporter
MQTVGLQLDSKWTDNYSTKIALSHGTDRAKRAIDRSVDQTRIASVLWQNEYRIGAHLLSATLEQRRDAFLLTSAPRVDRSKSQTASAWVTPGRKPRTPCSSMSAMTTTASSAARPPGRRPMPLPSRRRGRFPPAPARHTACRRCTSALASLALANLKPESGRNTEIGLKYAEGTSEFGVVVYQNKLTNLPDLPVRRGRHGLPGARERLLFQYAQGAVRGHHLHGRRKLGAYRLYGSLDLQNPRDVILDKQLPRRARRHAVVGVDTQVAGWALAPTCCCRPGVLTPPPTPRCCRATGWSISALRRRSPKTGNSRPSWIT